MEPRHGRKATGTEIELAGQFLARVAADDPRPGELADAAVAAFDRLYQHLKSLMGPQGFDVMLTRALRLTQTECAVLAGLAVEPSTDHVRLEGLQEQVHDRDAAVVRDCLIALLSNFIWLLVTLVGEEFAVRLVRGAWSAASPERRHAGTEQNEGGARCPETTSAS